VFTFTDPGVHVRPIWVFTLDRYAHTYSHVIPSLQRDAAKLMDAVFGEAR
jgi:hypothetical protein